MTCHKCSKKVHINKDFRSKGNGSGGNPPQKSANDIPEWVTNNPVVLDNKDFATSTITRNYKQYNWCTSCNNVQGAWGFHWKDGHEEWENKQGKKPSVRFSDPVTNAVIYCSYLMTTSEESMETENSGDDSQNNYFISLIRFE